MRRVVDEFGRLKADIAEMKAREKELREKIIGYDLPELDGFLFRVTVCDSTVELIDPELARQLLDAATLKKITKKSQRTVVKATSRIS